MNTIIKAIRSWLRKQNDAKLKRQIDEINSRISIKEKNGRLYLMCMGTAVKVFGDKQTCDDATCAITAARDAAQEFVFTSDEDKTVDIPSNLCNHG